MYINIAGIFVYIFIPGYVISTHNELKLVSQYLLKMIEDECRIVALSFKSGKRTVEVNN